MNKIEEVKPPRTKVRGFPLSRNPNIHSSHGLKPGDFCEGLKDQRINRLKDWEIEEFFKFFDSLIR
jgi:hypothetical protein